MAAPEETLPLPWDGFRIPRMTELDLAASGITNVIWATSYAFDFSLVKLPILDRDGFPIRTGGATPYPGLCFVGLPWLPNAKSGLLYGVGDGARSIAKAIMEREDGLSRDHTRKAAYIEPLRSISWTRLTTKTCSLMSLTTSTVA